MSDNKRLRLQIILFVLTIITTTLAGAEWMSGKLVILGDMSWSEVLAGLHYAVPFLLILTCHEFGHYLTARHYGIDVTLPYYIPFWFFGLPALGTAGAYIRIKEEIQSRKEYFDVGIAGPLAGFVVAIGFLYYGFTHLPEPEHIFQIHPEYEEYGLDYAQYVYKEGEGTSIRLGDNLLFWFFKKYVVEDPGRLPHPNEIYHYPYLLAGFLALFFTALNLLPIGQLDGGHVIFGLVGERHARRVSQVLFSGFLFYAGLGTVHVGMLKDVSMGSVSQFLLMLAIYLYFLYICLYSMIEGKKDRLLFATIILTLQFVVSTVFQVSGYTGWMLFGFLIGRLLGVYHPPVSDNRQLSTARKILGIVALIVFVVSFSPRPFIIS